MSPADLSFYSLADFALTRLRADNFLSGLCNYIDEVSETDFSLQIGEISGLPRRQTDSTFLQQRYETVFSNHSFTLII